jgi:hypothetical protein
MHLKLPIYSGILLTLAASARADIGDTPTQSAARYGKPGATATLSTGRLRMYWTPDAKYLVMEWFTHLEVVDIIGYFKMAKDAYTPDPMTQPELNELQGSNFPVGTTFPDTELELQADPNHPEEKVWKSDDGNFYIDMGVISGKNFAFGIEAPFVMFATAPGCYTIQKLIHSKEMDNLKPDAPEVIEKPVKTEKKAGRHL